MKGFVPEGYLPLRAALAKCGELWGQSASQTKRPHEVEIQSAWDRLRPKLHSGVLLGYYLRNGLPRPVDRGVWGTEHNDYAYVEGRVTFAGYDGTSSDPAFLKEDELQAFLEGKPVEPASTPQLGAAYIAGANTLPAEPSPPANKGGTPPKYALFLIEAFAILEWEDTTDLPKDAVELRARVMDRWAEKGESPVPEDWARKLIDPLWQRFKKETNRR